jgi:hypothetical protein
MSNEHSGTRASRDHRFRKSKDSILWHKSQAGKRQLDGAISNQAPLRRGSLWAKLQASLKHREGIRRLQIADNNETVRVAVLQMFGGLERDISHISVRQRFTVHHNFPRRTQDLSHRPVLHVRFRTSLDAMPPQDRRYRMVAKIWAETKKSPTERRG